MGPKTTPRRPQNESKIKTTNAWLFDRSWTRLGPVLRPSWAHLGVKKVALALRFPMFFEHRHFRTNDGWRRIFDSTWPDLGSQKGPKRRPRRAQNGPKTSPKSSPKSKRKNDRKMDGPWLHARHWGWTCVAPNAHWGVGGDQVNNPKTTPWRSSTPIGLKAWRIYYVQFFGRSFSEFLFVAFYTAFRTVFGLCFGRILETKSLEIKLFRIKIMLKALTRTK